MYLLARESANPLLRGSAVALLLYTLLFASQILAASRLASILLGLGLALLAVDVVLARRSILALGEAFWPDLGRSLSGAVFSALLFSSPIALTMVILLAGSPLHPLEPGSLCCWPIWW